ncbi:MAG: hypothetical protein UY92_C0021G0018 [Candidatus Magasanikbacteria bacterium GW2011_GWA2_56_11]|uniref:Uncharacterized protein n=1 Tax=Candidatus Magasanikbacteria bacterium GW2011_GWA2_56_11 TaxID=1619044 RepID=A0A0G2B7G2_9BACT|nr:MAG: hypothetical protein UY92_C0021G0018 [Candidatus Magasanikbacteria bacterium GW2011_GWA2_56_11]
MPKSGFLLPFIFFAVFLSVGCVGRYSDDQDEIIRTDAFNSSAGAAVFASSTEATAVVAAIETLPEVRRLHERIIAEYKSGRKITYRFDDAAGAAKGRVQVIVSEDTGKQAIAHYIFSLTLKGDDIRVIDPLTGEELTLEKWRDSQQYGPEPGRSLTMREYYRLIPKEYIWLRIDNIAQGSFRPRDSFISVLDESNYYLSLTEEAAGIQPSGGYGRAELALFLGQDGGPDILSVLNTTCVSIGCIDQDLQFYTYSGGRFGVVTKDVFPFRENLDNDYISKQAKAAIEKKYGNDPDNPEAVPSVVLVLPRYGTKIILREEKTRTDIYEFIWNGSKFTSHRVI